MSDWQSALSVITNALGVIKTAASAPGINLLPYVGTVATAAGALQTAIQTGIDVAPYITAISTTFSSGLPSDADRAALDAKIAELEAKVDAPLPAKEDGEED